MLVAVLIVVSGGMAAFAIDLARVYSGVTELQTGADAAALAGAHRLQYNPGTNATSSTQSFAANNSAFGSPLALDGADVEGGFWDPSAGSFTAGPWASANAVRVTARRSTGLGFGRLLGIPQLTPARRAVAWIGNQASQDCIKPWGIDVTYLNALVGQPITTAAGIAALRTQSSTLAGQQALTVVAGPQLASNRPGRVPPTIFSAMTGANNSSRKSYENAIRSTSCEGTADYTVGGAESIQPGQGLGDLPRTTADAVEAAAQTCKTRSGSSDATCYDPSQQGNVAGITVTIGATSPLSTNSVTLNALVGFQLLCVFRGSTANGNGPNQASIPGESCPWLAAAGLPANDYVRGTIVGYPLVTVAKTGNGNGLGNTLGPAQRLVLVQ